MNRRSRRRSAPDTGLRFPGYRDVVEIGGGAFATVYRAVEEGTERPVAIKLLRVDGLRSSLLESFDAELRALALVSTHPNIVTLYRPLTTPDGRRALILELCDGSYAQRVRAGGPLPAAEVLSVGVKIAGALETAHRAGFLHRDMKPQNILGTRYGEPALADFGVAALQASAQTTEGVFGFTTLHAPPEVLEGTPLSPATDVYGLASTLYQLLTGKAPFATYEGEAPAAVILRILRDPVAPVTASEVPIELSDLLGTALSKDPRGRPIGAVAFAEALRAVESHIGLTPTPYVVVGDAPAAPVVAGPSSADAPGPAAGAGRSAIPFTPAPPPDVTVPVATPSQPRVAPFRPGVALSQPGVAPSQPGLVNPAAAERRVVAPGAPPAPPPAPAAPAPAPVAPAPSAPAAPAVPAAAAPVTPPVPGVTPPLLALGPDRSQLRAVPADQPPQRPAGPLPAPTPPAPIAPRPPVPATPISPDPVAPVSPVPPEPVAPVAPGAGGAATGVRTPDLGVPVARSDIGRGPSVADAWAGQSESPLEQTVLPSIDAPTRTPARAPALRSLAADDDRQRARRRNLILVLSATAVVVAAIVALLVLGVI